MSKYGVATSPKIEKYFDTLVEETNRAYDLATKARQKDFDPENFVEVQLARNKAERIVGLISIVAPQIVGSGAVKRIQELEEQYGSNDWRVACVIALEIAQQKFCKFDTYLEAMEVGIRTGFAYNTDGVVSAPIEGFTKLNLKDRKDGKGKFFSLNFSGPIRNAGGTGAATCVIIADYIRTHLGYAEYDPDESEIARAHTELTDYHERVTNLQYFPSREEVDYLVSVLPVEIDGDPTDRIEVSNYKSLPRIATNFLRGGYCLILSSCVPLKAEKLWKQLSKWGAEMGLAHWDFMVEYLAIKKKAKSKGASKKSEGPKPRITPDYTYVVDLVAGRPVYGYPMRHGAFRIRLGRGRVTGLSAQGMSPASMSVLNDFIATGTQLKVERPGKAASFCSVDSIEGPTVKLNNGDVVYVDNPNLGFDLTKDISEIIYLGDALCCYGDYLNRAHSLIPLGYCEEWWIKDLKFDIEQIDSKIDFNIISKKTNISVDRLEKLFSDYLYTFPTFVESYSLAKSYGSYLHPKLIPHFKAITFDQTIDLIDWFKELQLDSDGRIVLPLQTDWQTVETPKRYLELIGVPHKVVQNENVVVDKNYSGSLQVIFGIYGVSDFSKKLDSVKKIFAKTKLEKKPTDDDYSFSVLNAYEKTSLAKIRDRSGVFVGTRMGRPEKAKLRAVKGSPNGIFPVGPEGGRMKTFKAALEAGKITTSARYFWDDENNCETVYKRSHLSGKIATQKQGHKYAGCDIKESAKWLEGKTPEEIERVTVNYKNVEIPIKQYFNRALQTLKTQNIPLQIKGLESLNSKDKTVERLEKCILRAKYNLVVNKDGTVRYDASEVPITHFKPKEIFVPWEKLKSLGYEFDIYGAELNSDDQILEILPNDIVVPCCPESGFEGADQILFRTAQFIDEELKYLYGMDPFYNAKSPLDIVGHIAIVLAPHVSAGILTRIIGFTKTQGLFAHPYIHCATRRDCDGDEAAFVLLMDSFLNFSKAYLPTHRGSTMDAPFVLTSILNPAEVDDMVFDMDVVDDYPRELYLAGLEFKMPWDIKIKTVKDLLGTPDQYENMKFTHHSGDFNDSVVCSAYKTLPSMVEKMDGQLDLARKIRAVDSGAIAELVIEKHFMKDMRGNLRGFSQQKFRCPNCNTIFRRPPLFNRCTTCKKNKIIFTISEGSVIKYLDASVNLVKDFDVSPYMAECVDLVKRAMDSTFGKEKEIQKGLSNWF